MLIVIYIPITEIFLISIKYVNGNIYGVKDSEACWGSMHYLNLTLGIIGSILLLLWCTFMVNFNFYPFQKLMSTIRITFINETVCNFTIFINY